MPIRGLIIGVTLALWIATFTLFNDTVILQPLMTGNLLPTAVFGLVTLLVVLGLTGRRRLGMGDLALIVVLATAACAWPGANFFRTFVGTTAHVINLHKAATHWQASDALSYVPGGAPRLGEAHLVDWTGLLRRLTAPAADRDRRLAEHIQRLLPPRDRQLLADLEAARPSDRPAARNLRRVLNGLIERQDLYDPDAFAEVDLDAATRDLVAQFAAGRLTPNQVQRLNRQLLVDAWPEHVRPLPQGQGAVLAGGQEEPGVTDVIVHGSDDPDRYRLGNVPWGAWWPVIRLWIGLAALVGVACVCLAVIVQPQWAQNERLPYPVVRFLEELVRPAPEARSRRPAILGQRLFWLGLAGAAGLHLVNGLHAWFPALPQVPLSFDFTALQALAPATTQAPQHVHLFKIDLYLSVIAFAYFVRTDVSLSLGSVAFVWVAVGTVLASYGQRLTDGQFEPHAGPMLRCGAYLGFAAMILYFGRRHYGAVLAGTLGLRLRQPAPRAAVWAGRVLLLSLVAAVALMSRYGGLDWRLGLLVMLSVLLMLVVLARIVAETGAFYVQPNWMPLGLMMAVFGFQGLGPQAFIFIALASAVLVGDPRESLMGYLVNGLHAGQRMARWSLGRLAWTQGAMVLASLAVALTATLVLVYTRGVSPHDRWGVVGHPSSPFDALVRRLQAAGSLDALHDAAGRSGWEHFLAMQPDTVTLGVLALGAGLVVACAWARLRLPAWPVHPVLFLVLGTTPAMRLAWSFFFGWLVKLAVVRLVGARGYPVFVPLMIGAIAGELLAAVGWQVVGIGYYFLTGQIPAAYFILPR